MSSRTRAERRHERNRILAKRYRQDRRWSVWESIDAEAWRFRNARMRTNTGTLCSCTMCASARRLYGNGAGGRTRQELVAFAKLQERE